MKALIIEDDKAAVRNLMALLGEVDPDIEVIDVLDSITDSVAWFQSAESAYLLAEGPSLVRNDLVRE